ncbi:MAG TPA: SAM-dependent methyltransferase [Micromonosporaceae bacterium]|nr:SAM-dependent methyltransferase [Micromonosporaceae bacterium]
MERLGPAPEGVDIDRPSVARMQDYALGGSHNLAVDRDLIAQIAQLAPDLTQHVHADRACLRRMVSFCAEVGIRQFLDLGSDLPTRGSVSDVVQRAAPGARVVHIDVERVALKPSYEVRGGGVRPAVVPADPHQPEQILTSPQVRRLLDFEEPMAVLLRMLHFIPDDATAAVAAFRDAVAPGSYLAIFHMTAETRPAVAEVQQMLQRVGLAVRPRSRAEVERLFEGLELVGPGVVWTHEWRPDPRPGPASDLDRPVMLSGVGRKPVSCDISARTGARPRGVVMRPPSAAPESFGTDRPSLARMHDHALGGSHNLAVDRALVAQVAQLMPDMMPHVRADRACLRRMVSFCIEAGVRQFLDLSWGLPVRGNVTDVVHQMAPEARVVHVDIEPDALLPSYEIPNGYDRTGVVRADAHQPEKVLTDPQVRGLLDFNQPIAVLLITLHFVPDNPAGVVAAFRDAVAPGSYLAVFHMTAETRPEEMAEIVQMMQHGGLAVRPRPRAEVERLFEGLDLVEPGLVWTHEWRPDPHGQAGDLDRPFILSGIGRKA